MEGGELRWKWKTWEEEENLVGGEESKVQKENLGERKLRWRRRTSRWREEELRRREENLGGGEVRWRRRTWVGKENFKVEGGKERMGGCWKRISAQLFYQVSDHHQHQRHLPSSASSSSS